MALIIEFRFLFNIANIPRFDPTAYPLIIYKCPVFLINLIVKSFFYQLILSLGQLILSLDQLILSLGHLILSLGQLILSLGQLILSLGQLILSLGQLILSLGQLILSLSQLILSLGQLILSSKSSRSVYDTSFMKLN